jgi:hypothetical protein
MKSSMTQGDTQSNDYKPCEIPPVAIGMAFERQIIIT